MKTFLCVVASALTLVAAPAVIGSFFASPRPPTAVSEPLPVYQYQPSPTNDDALYGVVSLGVYASKCMSPNDPLRTATLEKMADLLVGFSQTKRQAAGEEVMATLNRVGVREFCRRTEAAVAR